MEQYNSQNTSLLKNRKFQTVLITVPATMVAVVGVVVLIPAIVWFTNQYGSSQDQTDQYVIHVYLSSNYILIASLLVYFPLHMALAFTGHWIIQMASVFIGCVSIASGGSSMFYYGINVWASNHFYPEDHDLHYDLGFAGSFLSTFAVAASLTIVPLLTKFRERTNTWVPYTPLGVRDNYSSSSVPVSESPQGTFQPQPGAGHQPQSMAFAPHSHPPLPPYSHMDYIGQSYPTQPPPQADGHGKDNQPQAELQAFSAVPSAPPLQ